MASLDTLPLTGSSVQRFSYQLAYPTGHAATFSYRLLIGRSYPQQFEYDLEVFTGDPCWESYTQKLLGYLEPRVFRAQIDSTSLLHQVFSMVARELTICTETVALMETDDARGDGNWHVHVRFEPVLEVPLVQRVDDDGNILEEYAVEDVDGRTLTVSGAVAPKAGDNLVVTYSYLHKGLEYGVREALQQLNILTSTDDFLDEWGRWFGVPRQATGNYGDVIYGSGTYGVPGAEDDAHYSRRIIDRVLQSRNTKPAIVGAVQTVTGGSPYIVEWLDPVNPTGWIYNVAGEDPWDGTESAAALSKHLIMGRTSRFRNASASGGGAYVFEVWVPPNSGYSAARLLEIVNQYKAAGTRAFIRFQET